MTLGVRLRELRRTALPRPVRQSELAEALEIRNTTVSTWESDKRVPRPELLRDIATFYASPRSLDGPTLLDDTSLHPEERTARDRILTELRALRGEPQATPRNPWHFPDGGPVRIICGALEPAERPRYASGRDHNYMALSAYADQDALVELFGHIRSENPGSDVQFELAPRLEPDDLPSHLVVLGNLGWLARGALLPLPVRPMSVEGLDGEVFESDDGTTYGPVLEDPDDLESPVVEDVALFWRAPNPVNPSRTLTVCSGVFTRGVYAAVRLFSDRLTRDANIQYLHERFPDEARFGVLARARAMDHATVTPQLGDGAIRLAEFPSPET